MINFIDFINALSIAPNDEFLIIFRDCRTGIEIGSLLINQRTIDSKLYNIFLSKRILNSRITSLEFNENITVHVYF